MKVSQQNVPAFYIDNENEEQTLAYIEKNAPLLKGHLLVFFHAVSEAVSARCEAWKLCYVLNSCAFKKRGKQNSLPESLEPEPEVVQKKEIFKPVRSGENIEYKGDLLISGNINDGASVICEGCLTLFGIIEGNISCNGDYMIASLCRRGRVMFREILINEFLQDEKLKMFYIKNDALVVKELM